MATAACGGGATTATTLTTAATVTTVTPTTASATSTTTGPTTTVLEARVRSFTDQQIEMFYLFVGDGTILEDPEEVLLGLGGTACSGMDTFNSVEEYGAFLENLSRIGDDQLVLIKKVSLAAGAALCPEHAPWLEAALQAANS